MGWWVKGMRIQVVREGDGWGRRTGGSLWLLRDERNTLMLRKGRRLRIRDIFGRVLIKGSYVYQ